ncbi:nucleotidyltransferase family protein [Pseudobacteroides cellulosolvens]|uniref:Nucleotidyl transferase n=1 Tax=Pseudobacteroides cellulosolvens ATCC 35603 = DSM 2933 TaxID=398512 RepID=A0A0L6JSB8_9FIRM|nr:sugar phosphate nucleotidyltransferase [Pseudobacteroides cellulosolvens]KNY28619.1 Nucleotidyl transferase [Pseudobacteroides cellulosolvens ATCC 35603 = DSM 2933]
MNKSPGYIKGKNSKEAGELFVFKKRPVCIQRENYVVLMAGGRGNRLKPLTNEIPKPMLKVGNKPILQIIMELFKSYGFENFIISINYLADIVEGYFGDGGSFGVNIEYFRESKGLGTAGCIRHLKKYLKKPFYVMNGDVITKLNVESMMKYHIDNKFDLTIGVKKYQYTLPYGVVNTDGGKIKSIVEKPVESWQVNGGIYCLMPHIIDLIPEDESFDITCLIEKCINNGANVGAYEINDYWVDIGHIEDYYKANHEYAYIYGDCGGYM